MAEHDPTARRLAAILFTDIVGYTALMGRDEAAGRRVRERHEAVVRPLVARYQGEWVEERGDESLSIFGNARDAVNCALAIQQALADDPELKLRIGVHSGDVTFERGRVIGDGVNVASRIRALAEPGGIFVSGQVYDSIKNQSNCRAIAQGERELKNVDRPVAVYAVTGTAVEPTALHRPARVRALSRHSARWATAGLGIVIAALLALAWWRSQPDELPPIRSLAVLPLENLSGDPEQEYFADATTDVLTGELAKVGSLSVISRTSVMQYKDTRKTAREIASELGVDGLIEGTVFRQGNQVRITVQLVGRNDRHIWAEQFEGEFDKFFPLQMKVARSVAEGVQIQLTPQEETLLTEKRSVDSAALDAYLRGSYHLGLLTTTDVMKAIAYFEQAVQEDPSFALAHAKLALTYVHAVLGMGEISHEQGLPKMREAARAALALDDALGVAHTALGVSLVLEWKWERAERELARGIELSPNSPFSLNRRSWYLSLIGRHEEALSLASRAVELAPNDLGWRAHYGYRLCYAQRYQAAIDEGQAILEMRPSFAYHQVWMWIAYQQLGDSQSAYRSYLEFYRVVGFPWQVEALERGFEEGGPDAAMRVWLEVTIDRMRTSEEYIEPPYGIAITFASIGEWESAFEWLEQAYEARDPLMIMLGVDPLWDPLRSDPRFADLLRRINYPGN